MRAALIALILLVTHAGGKGIPVKNSPSTTIPHILFDIISELQKFCLTPDDIQELNNIPNYNATDAFNYTNMIITLEFMGFSEMRAELKMTTPPLPLLPLIKLKDRKEDGSPEELFLFLEQKRRSERFNKSRFNEKNINHTIEFLDKRAPSVRKLIKYVLKIDSQYYQDSSENSAIWTMLYSVGSTSEGISRDMRYKETLCKQETDNTRSYPFMELNVYYADFYNGLEQHAVRSRMLKSCPTDDDVFTYKIPNGTLFRSLEPTMDAIGIEELRAVLNFTGRETRNILNITKIEEELEKDKPYYVLAPLLVGCQTKKDADTLEEYYNLNEPGSVIRTLDIKYFYNNNSTPLENNLESSIAYLDNNYPELRRIYRARFQTIRAQGELDKKMIDKMLDEFYLTYFLFHNDVITCYFLPCKCH